MYIPYLLIKSVKHERNSYSFCCRYAEEEEEGGKEEEEEEEEEAYSITVWWTSLQLLGMCFHYYSVQYSMKSYVSIIHLSLVACLCCLYVLSYANRRRS